MTKVSTTISFAVVAAMAIASKSSVTASYVRRLVDDDSNSADFEHWVGSSDDSEDGSSSFDAMYAEEMPMEETDAVPKYGQCGGIGYDGNSKCARGHVCVISNPWFAQCLPRGATASVTTKKHGHPSKLLVDDADLLVEDVSDESSEADVVPAWEQCGGKGVDFDFSMDDSLPGDETPKQVCEEGYTCEVVNEWYYQCQPLPDLTGIHLWEQCGGEDYRGPTECQTGSVCKLFNNWYSQCVPKEQEFSVYLLDYKLLRHLIDSAAHGSVAFCCWAIFLLQRERYSESGDTTFSSLGVLKKCFLSGLTASLLDVDHFIAAGALSLAGATHLNGRPFGHAVTFIIVVALLVNRCSRKCQARKRRYRVCFIVVAWFSHQLRDGMRRGLWFWPLGSTPPVNYFLYLAMEEALPFVMAKWWRRAPAMTEMEKLELALQKADEESEEESEEDANSGDEEEGSRLLVSADVKERSSSPTPASPRRKLSEIIV
ncbi:unnamed protein product [Phytophthora lilii]|uniref:Transmembrane protein 267 n=1 Tax=Phytophthora lilii TaxID=2077276 RepID=A0A9W6WMR2_9STRA|nr:unnamed protein product [Phytophthora lilii]